MLPRLPFVLSFFLVLHLHTAAQETDNTAPYKNINGDGYVRLCSDNDYFNGTDDQYTEGINFEISLPAFKNGFIWKLLLHPHYSYTTYGIGVEQAGYTPENLHSDSIQYGDRPFAATLFLKTFLITTDTVRKQRFSTTLCTGAIGFVAQGGELQDAVHEMLNFVQPPGWKYQVHDDIILNYQVDYQKQLLSYRNIFLADAEAMVRAGTLSDKQGIGLNVMLGYFQSPYGGNVQPRAFHIFFYDNPEVDVVEYDATLEGGAFIHNSPYTIPAAHIIPVTFSNRMGIIMSCHSLSLEYSETFLTKQFSTGPQHAWGTVGVIVSLKSKKGGKG